MADLLAQDVVLAVRLLLPPPGWTFQSLGESIGISQSQCHLSFGRLLASSLVEPGQRVTIKSNLQEFLVHGVKYAFPARLREPTIGVPTAHAAPIWEQKLLSNDERVVWKHPAGKTRGAELVPLYKTVPAIALKERHLYSIFAVVDSIRLGRARERDVAANLLKDLIYG